MTSVRALALLAAASAAAACGPSKEARLMRERSATCNALMTQPNVTLGDALSQLSNTYGYCASVTPETATPLANDTCGGVPIYRLIIPFPPTDPSLCKSTPYGQECGYFCEMHVTATDYVANAGGTSTPLCASQWYGPACLSTNFCPIYFTC